MSNISNPFKKVKYTERTVNQILVEWINRIIEDIGLPLGKVRQETILADQKQPDIVVFDTDNKKIVALIELKPPSWDIYSYELIHEAYRKASRISSNYFATWNINKLVLFSVKKYEEVKDEDKSISDAIVQKYDFSNIKILEQIDEPEHKAALQDNIKKFLKELVDIAKHKKASPKISIDQFFISRLRATIDSLQVSFKDLVIAKSKRDTKFLNQVRNWFNEQAWSFSGIEEDYEKLARQAAYLLVNKLVFYGALQEKLGLDPLEIPKSLTSGERLQGILKLFFADILKIDYETIFTTDFIDEIAFPQDKTAIDSVKDLVAEINKHKISAIGYDVLGGIFQKLIPEDERHLLGQYFTNSDIVDFILKFCLRGEKDFILDPGCGAGTFLVRAYQHKKLSNPRIVHDDILHTLWGIDISKFAAHLSTINIAVNDLGSIDNYPRIIHKDFFDVAPSQIGFNKPIKVKGLGTIEKEIEHPQSFDAVVGNPPYTRQEEIEDLSVEGYKKNLIKKALHETGANISKRAGIHAYFFVHGTKFLKDGGRFGFIVSNSWLDVDYGKGLQEFFLKNYKITAIIESKVERWFEDADINTCIVLLEKCSNKKGREENYVRFVQLKKKLRYFIPIAESIWEKEIKRLEEIEKLRKLILAHKEHYENEDVRIYPIKQIDLWSEGFNNSHGYAGAKWGKYIRAPEIFFEIIERGKDLFVPLKEIADVRRGFTTGANEFFYLTEEEIKQWAIEKEFWMHKENGKWVPNYVIKSPRECKGIIVNPEDLKFRVLMIHKDRKELKGTNVLKYIEYGEEKGFDKRPTCASRKIWWDLGSGQYADLNIAMYYQQSFKFHLNQKVYSGDALTEVYTKTENITPILTFLNSTVGYFYPEVYGRSYGGGGAPTGFKIYEVMELLVFNPSKLSKSQTQKLEQSFDKLCQREIGSVFEELGANLPEEVSLDKVKPDRRELDKIIMGEVLGLTEKEQLEVYKAVIDLVKSRIEKAKSLGNKKKIKKGIDVDKAVEIIVNSIGKDSFSNFYKENILAQKADFINIPKFIEPIQIKRTLIGFSVADKRHDKKEEVKCSTYEKAKYIALLATMGMDKIAMPKDEAYLKQVLEKLQKTSDMIKEDVESHISSIVDKKLQIEIKHKVMSALINEIK